MGIGMYLVHNGVVRETARARVRDGETETRPVRGMRFSYDRETLDAVIADAQELEGIHYIRVWLNEGELQVGDDLMYVLVGGDIRPHVIDAMQCLVGRIKQECVKETEVYDT